jgi:hypothetical protein
VEQPKLRHVVASHGQARNNSSGAKSVQQNYYQVVVPQSSNQTSRNQQFV